MAGLFLAVSGCSTFGTKQEDSRKERVERQIYADHTNEITHSETVVQTGVKAKALWSAKSRLLDFEAKQTEKTQGAKVGSLNQEATNNLSGNLDALERVLIQANKLKSPMP